MSKMHYKHNAKRQSHIENFKDVHASDDRKLSYSHSNEATNTPCDENVDDKPSSNIPPVTATFPEKLMFILDNEDMYGNNASWLPDGRSFVIRSPHQFAEKVLPHFFSRGCKFDSFMRKLYYWGFKKTKSKGRGTEVKFHHKNFCRGSAPSCMHLRTIQRLLKKPENMNSTASNKTVASVDNHDGDGNMSTWSEETKSSVFQSDDAQKLRMVKEAMDIYATPDQNDNLDAVPSERRSPLSHPQVTRQVPNQLPLLVPGNVNYTSFTSLPFVENRLRPSIRESNIRSSTAVHHQLGNDLQRRMVQNQLLTTTSLKPFCHVNQARPLLKTNQLSFATIQGSNAASLLSRSNVLRITTQPNTTELSYCLNNVSNDFTDIKEY